MVKQITNHVLWNNRDWYRCLNHMDLLGTETYAQEHACISLSLLYPYYCVSFILWICWYSNPVSKYLGYVFGKGSNLLSLERRLLIFIVVKRRLLRLLPFVTHPEPISMAQCKYLHCKHTGDTAVLHWTVDIIVLQNYGRRCIQRWR